MNFSLDIKLLILIVLGCFVLTVLIRCIFFSFFLKNSMILDFLYKVLNRNNKKKTNRIRNLKITKVSTEFSLMIFANIYFVCLSIYRLLINPLLLVVIYIGFYIFIYKNITIDINNTINLYKLLKIKNPTDNSTLYILNFITQSIKIIVPLSFPFFYFIYKEQKSISDSSLNGRSNSIYFTLFILFSLSSAFHILNITKEFNAVDESDRMESLNLTDTHKYDLTLVTLFIILSVYFLGKLVEKSFRNLSLEDLLQRKINDTYLIYYFMCFRSSRIYKGKQYYEYLTGQVETIYQALIQASNKNLGRVYDKAYIDLENLLYHFGIDYRLGSFDTTTKQLYLLKKYQKIHLSFYKNLLKNHKELIIHLIQQHKIQDSKKAIKLLLDLIPPATTVKSDNSIYNEYLANYYTILYELLTYLYESGNNGIDTVVEKLRNEKGSIETVEQEGILRILQALIIKACDKDDVKMLSTLSYILSSFYQSTKNNVILKESLQDNERIQVVENEEVEEVEEKYFLKFLGDNQKDLGIVFKKDENMGNEELLKFLQEKGSNESTDYYEKLLSATIFMFLQALLKSIEISKYKTTGFLVKFLVTSYEYDIFNKVFIKFIKAPNTNPYWILEDSYSDIDNDFHMNSNVENYLIVKLSILLFSQQTYVSENKVDFRNIPEQFIDISQLNKINYLGYLFRKLDKTQKDYGLLFLQDEQFMKEIQSKFHCELLIKKI